MAESSRAGRLARYQLPAFQQPSPTCSFGQVRISRLSEDHAADLQHPLPHRVDPTQTSARRAGPLSGQDRRGSVPVCEPVRGDPCPLQAARAHFWLAEFDLPHGLHGLCVRYGRHQRGTRLG